MVQHIDSIYYRTEFLQQIEKLKNDLSDKFEIATYTIGQNASKEKAVSYTEKLTKLSAGLTQIADDHYNLNHAATLLLSDGIYNQGSNPVYTLKKGTPPIYTMALGDSTQHKDAILAKVKHNATVYTGNSFEIIADCKAFYCNNDILYLTLQEGKETIYKGQLKANGNNFFGSQKIVLDKAKEGIHTYKLGISPIKDEINKANNSAQFQINVLRNKQKIVLLYQTPHPDIKAVLQSIENNANFEIQSFLLSDYKDQGIADASLFILHQIPGQRGEGLKLVQRLQQNNIPLFFITGRQTGLPFLAQAGSLKVQGGNQSFNESQAYFNTQFSLFQMDEELQQAIQKFPPLFCPYGNYQIPGDAQTLMYQQIGYVKTNSPLLFFGSSKGANQVFLCGEGFWRWRLQDFFLNQNQQYTQTFMSKIVQWASGKTDRSKFRVNPSKKFYDENESVVFEAELFNDLYELQNEPDISLNLINEKKKVYTYQFSKTEKAYQLDLGNLPAGEYAYEAKVNGQQKIEPKKGIIHVKALQTEALQTKANDEVLKALSSETGGTYFQRNQWEQLKEDLLNHENMKTIVYKQEEMKALLNQKWLFFLLIGLLTIEWFIRKWNGFI
jgi:hypothetical protein